MRDYARRLKTIERKLMPGREEKLPIVIIKRPNGDGTFTEIPGCWSLNDPQIALGVARAGRRADDDEI